MKELLNEIITILSGEKPVIHILEDEQGAVVSIYVSGRVSWVIGKNGATIASIRTLAKAIGINGKHRIKLELHEN